MSQPPAPGCQPLSPEEQALALEELRKILNSASFYRSRRHSDLLSYLVRLTLAGHEHTISEYSIAWEVYNKEESFNPQIDAAMRVEVRRLRARLEGYYATEGTSCQMQISLPSGYIPKFSRRESTKTVSKPVHIESQQSTSDSSSNSSSTAALESQADVDVVSKSAPAHRWRRLRLWTTVALAVVATGSGLFVMARAFHRRTKHAHSE